MKIICYGDSNTYGYDPNGGPALRHPADGRWVDLLAKSLHAGESGSLLSGVFNAGQNGREIPHNGWESAEGVAGQLAAATKPGGPGSLLGAGGMMGLCGLMDSDCIGDLIIIMLGSNDVLLSGLTAEQTAAKMCRFLGAVKMEAPGRQILLIAPVSFTEGFWVPDRRTIEESVKLPKLYEQMAEDMYDGESLHAAPVRFADANEWGVELTDDGVHFTKEGHKAFAEGLTKALKLWYPIG